MTQTNKLIVAYVALIAFLSATILTSFINLGHLNDALAFVFAMAKALTILYFFMQFKSFDANNRILFLLGILTLIILILGVMDDVFFRPV